MITLHLSITGGLEHGPLLQALYKKAVESGLTPTITTAPEGPSQDPVDTRIDRLLKLAEDQSAALQLLMEEVVYGDEPEPAKPAATPPLVVAPPFISPIVPPPPKAAEQPAPQAPAPEVAQEEAVEEGEWHIVKATATQPLAIRKGDEILLSPQGLAMFLDVNPTTAFKYVSQSKTGRRIRPVDGKLQMYVCPYTIVPYIASTSKNITQTVKKYLGPGVNSLRQALQLFIENGGAPAASPVKEHVKDDGPLTNNSSVQELLDAARSAGCTVNNRGFNHVIEHPQLPKPLFIPAKSEHLTPNIFRRMNRLINGRNAHTMEAS